MALDRLTQITNSGISSNATITVTGVIAGVTTLGNTVVGGATTQLIVNGNTRITGILTIGTSSVTLDGTNNQVNVGSGVTIHHTNGVQVGSNTLHSSGLTINSLNASGIVTASGFVGNVTGNATGLSGTPNITVGTIGATSVNASGVVTATSFSGSGANLTGIAVTENVRTNSLVVSGMTTATGGIQVGATTSIVIGNTFLRSNSIGIGSTTTTGRNAGVGTASGTIIFNLSTQTIEAYGVGLGTQSTYNGWFPIKTVGTSISNGQQIFTSSGTFVVPDGVYKIRVWLTGGGGGGGGAAPSRGGSGGQTGVKTIYVTPGQSISVVIGSGGKGEGSPVWLGPGPTNYGKAGNGGQSSFGSYLTASGGSGGDGPTTVNPPLGAPQPVGSDSGFDFLIYGVVGSGQNAPNTSYRSMVGGPAYFGVGGGGGEGTVYYAGGGYQGGGGGTGLYLGGSGGNGYCLIEWDNI